MLSKKSTRTNVRSGMYRPGEWDAESIVIDVYQNLTIETTDEKEQKLVEAGADAILEGLKEGIGCCEYHSTKESQFGRNGCFVFIPEDDDGTK